MPGLSSREALRDPALWRIGVSNFVVMALTMGLTIHLFPILTEAGIDRSTAAWMTSLSGLAAISESWSLAGCWVGGLTLAAAALAFLLLFQGIRSPALILIAMLVNGYAAGTKTPITGLLTARYGGMRNFGKIYGIMSALLALAAGLGHGLIVPKSKGRGFEGHVRGLLAGNELAVKIGRVLANVATGIEQRKYDPCQTVHLDFSHLSMPSARLRHTHLAATTYVRLQRPLPQA